MTGREACGLSRGSVHITANRANSAKKNELNPWLVKRWGLGKITGAYIWPREDMLDLDEQPDDPLPPVVCCDERPCQLLGAVLAPIPMTPGQPTREDYEDARHGTCGVLLAFAPLRSWRVLHVRKQRTAVDEALFMKELGRIHSPNIASIRLVQDNFNTHTSGAFYEALPPQEAFELAQKVESHYTPRTGSWLNMAAIEVSALAQPCLNRHIGDMATFTKEATVWNYKRNKARKPVQWAFTKRDARRKLTHQYPMLQD